MVQLLKIREQIFRFVGRFEVYVMAGVRFVIAYAAFSMINSSTGYMKILTDYPIALILALLCSFLPTGMMMFFGAVLILLQFYALSNILCLITAMIFVILFCVYLRFSERKGLYTVMTPLLSAIGIPYTMPVASGLMDGPYSVISVICGEVAYFLMKHVSESSALFSSVNEASTNSTIALAATEILMDKEMYLYLAAFAIAAIAVYCVRKLPVDQSYLASVVVGIVVQLVLIGGGEVYLGNSEAVPRIVIGCVVSLAIMLVIAFMTHSLDYSRVERVQFEDDEYYYYVKAVPKAFVLPEDKQVKHIHRKKTRGKKNTKGKKPNAETESEQEDSLEEQVKREFGEQ
ncbi:MAG: hypothetical protein LUD14_01145 [Clostridiales bacterium]|nr:hypothetical protein [Clostridiales bacterium]